MKTTIKKKEVNVAKFEQNWSFLVVLECIFKFLSEIVSPGRIDDFLRILSSFFFVHNFKISLILSTFTLLLLTCYFSILMLRRQFSCRIPNRNVPLEWISLMTVRNVHSSKQTFIVIVHFRWQSLMLSVRNLAKGMFLFLQNLNLLS